MSGDSRTDRRRFLKTVGLAGASSALLVPVLSVPKGARWNGGSGTAVAAEAPDTAGVARDEPEVSADARALAGIIERRYGEQLGKGQLESIARNFDGDLRAAKRLRAVRLLNGDEPDFTFRA